MPDIQPFAEIGVDLSMFPHLKSPYAFGLVLCYRTMRVSEKRKLLVSTTRVLTSLPTWSVHLICHKKQKQSENS